MIFYNESRCAVSGSGRGGLGYHVGGKLDVCRWNGLLIHSAVSVPLVRVQGFCCQSPFRCVLSGGIVGPPVGWTVPLGGQRPEAVTLESWV